MHRSRPPRELRVVLRCHGGRLVALQPDVAHAGAGHDVEHRLEHPQPGTKHWHDDDVGAHLVPVRDGQWRRHRGRARWQVTRGFGRQQEADPPRHDAKGVRWVCFGRAAGEGCPERPGGTRGAAARWDYTTARARSAHRLRTGRWSTARKGLAAPWLQWQTGLRRRRARRALRAGFRGIVWAAGLRLLGEDADVGQVAVEFAVVQSVADDEAVLDQEPDVVDLDIHGAARRLAQQASGSEAAGRAGAEDFLEVGQRGARCRRCPRR